MGAGIGISPAQFLRRIARRGGPCAGKIHPISLVLPKETGWSPKERRFRCNLAAAQTPQSDNGPHRRPRAGALRARRCRTETAGRARSARVQPFNFRKPAPALPASISVRQRRDRREQRAVGDGQSHSTTASLYLPPGSAWRFSLGSLRGFFLTSQKEPPQDIPGAAAPGQKRGPHGPLPLRHKSHGPPRWPRRSWSCGTSRRPRCPG